MASHPLNLALRFLLKIAVLVAIGCWGFHKHTGIMQFLLGIGLRLLAAVASATFRLPGDASVSDDAPVAVPGGCPVIH